MSLAIWWIRRDLRLADNPALRAALEQYQVVLPVFIQAFEKQNSPQAFAA